MSVSVACLLVGGREYSIRVGQQTIRFEMHDVLGPMPVNRDGSEKALGAKHKFWEAVSRWAEQGRRADEHGQCLWNVQLSRSSAEA